MHRFLSGLVLLGVLGACGGNARPGQTAVRIEGQRQSGADHAAGEALAAAATAMHSATSFRFDASVEVAQTPTHVTGEFQAPDRLHETATAARGVPVEFVFVGTRAFVKDPTKGVWRSRLSTAPGAADPRAAFDVLNQAEAIHIEGGEYRFTLTGAAAASIARSAGATVTPATVTGSAVLAGPSLSRLDLDVAGTTPIHMTITYRDVGAAPPVEQPTVAAGG